MSSNSNPSVVTAGVTADNIDKPLHKLLEDFQSKLQKHLSGKRLDDAQLDEVSQRVFETDRNNADTYIDSVQSIVSDLTSVAHNWREHKNELARKIPLIYISIACIGQCSAIFAANDQKEIEKEKLVKKLTKILQKLFGRESDSMRLEIDDLIVKNPRLSRISRLTRYSQPISISKIDSISVGKMVELLKYLNSKPFFDDYEKVNTPA